MSRSLTGGHSRMLKALGSGNVLRLNNRKEVACLDSSAFNISQVPIPKTQTRKRKHQQVPAHSLEHSGTVLSPSVSFAVPHAQQGAHPRVWCKHISATSRLKLTERMMLCSLLHPHTFCNTVLETTGSQKALGFLIHSVIPVQITLSYLTA